jgi:hypothetical protein
MGQLIGISGFARSGKDTFFQRSSNLLSKEGKQSKRYAFADALKEELDELLLKYTGISAFTEENKDKELIRPLLVTYGTELRRKLNQNCWIEKIQDRVIDSLNRKEYVFITDVRFKNEAEWIRMNGGLLVNVSRAGVTPANHEEHKQLHLMKRFITHNCFWETYGDNHLDKCDEHVAPILSHILKMAPRPQIEEVL